MKRKKMILDVLVCIMVLLLTEIPVYPATTGVSTFLETNKIYTNYDLDGDGKKDNIILKESKKWDHLNTAYFMVDGKRVYTLLSKISDYETVFYRIITLQNGKVFIYVGMEGANSGNSKQLILSYEMEK